MFVFLPFLAIVLSAGTVSSSGQCAYSGVGIGSSCWYTGLVNASCTQTCLSMNLIVDEATLNYAGSLGTALNCAQVVSRFPPLKLQTTPIRGAGNRGCYWRHDTQSLHWESNLTAGEAAGGNAVRFCACHEDSKWSWKASFAAVSVMCLFVALAFDMWTSEYLLFTCSLVFFLAGIIDLSDLVMGFSNTGILTVAVLYICVRPLNDLPLLRNFVLRYILSTAEVVSVRKTLLTIFIFVAFVSSWLNNTPLVALMIPFIKDWCRERNLAPSMFLLPVSYAAIFGGICTVIGTSTNLVVQGFLERDGHRTFSFFELGPAGGWLCCFVGACYVVALGPVLLPKTGGMFRLIRERGAEFMIQLEASSDSPLVGKHVEALRSFLPAQQQNSVVFVEIVRKGSDGSLETIFPLTGTEIVCTGDKLVLSGNVKAILSSITATTGLRLVTVSLDEIYGRSAVGAGEVDNKSDLPRVPSRSALGTPTPPIRTPSSRSPPGTPPMSGGPPLAMTNSLVHPDVCLDIDPLPAGSEDAAAAAPATNLNLASPREGSHAQAEFFEVVIGRSNLGLGFTVSQGEFQRVYRASIIAVRQAEGGDRLAGDLESLVLNIGDCLLVLAGDRFYDQWRASSDFFVVSRCGMSPDEVPDDRFYVTLPRWTPRWCCLRQRLQFRPITLAHRNASAPCQNTEGSQPDRINLPWFPYLSAVSFVLMVLVSTAADMNLLGCAFVNAVFLIGSGILSPKQALQSVDASVYVMVASSFGIGKGIQSSGLALAVAKALTSNIKNGLGLHIITALITTFSTSVVTNNASAAIIYPLAAATAKELGLPSKSLAAIVAVAASLDFSTPFGYQTNIMVQGPGGYRCRDYARMGLPLNIVCPILLAFNVYYFYLGME
eukprot:NODE_193_length_2806_cov_23.393906_g176_i0.p1 GENE.NODE_193_length_2806_cov_23.393906_g176_i0~~NODE_193_length_2806_cov_23.393906_g176_i0.p1  ORF type:complete len:885 (-),score=117.74 NODE_193_length_2806_cov_23.393906_g176_i0:91-2745(-)